MGFTPPPNLWKMTDAQVQEWWESECRRDRERTAIVAVVFVLFGLLVFAFVG